MASNQSIANLINAIFNGTQSITNSLNAATTLQNTKKLAEFNNWLKLQNDERTRDINSANAVNTANFNTANTELQESIDFLTAHNVTRDLYSNKVLEKYKTEDMKKILKDEGIEITDALEVRMSNVGTHQEKMEQYANATKYMNEINDSLNLMESKIMGLNTELENVALDEGYKGLLDLDDINAHIDKPENAELFKEPIYLMDPDNKSNVKLNAAGDPTIIGYSPKDNYLARAFRSEKITDKTGTVGFVPQYTKWQVKDVVQPALEKTNMFAYLTEIEGIYNQIAIEHGDAVTPDYTWLKESGFSEILDWKKGGASQWEKDPEALGRMKARLEGKIIKIVEKATSGYGMFKPIPKEQTEIRNAIGLKPPKVLVDGKLVDGEGFQVDTDSDLMNQAVRYLYNRWIGDGVIHTNHDTGERTFVPNPRLSGTEQGGAVGLFSQKYADDKMYHVNIPDGGYGAGGEDLMLYKMIQLWNSLDKLAPSISGSLDLLDNNK